MFGGWRSIHGVDGRAIGGWYRVAVFLPHGEYDVRVDRYVSLTQGLRRAEASSNGYDHYRTAVEQSGIQATGDDKCRWRMRNIAKQ